VAFKSSNCNHQDEVNPISTFVQPLSRLGGFLFAARRKLSVLTLSKHFSYSTGLAAATKVAVADLHDYGVMELRNSAKALQFETAFEAIREPRSLLVVINLSAKIGGSALQSNLKSV
jgi:hypothetical protein